MLDSFACSTSGRCLRPSFQAPSNYTHRLPGRAYRGRHGQQKSPRNSHVARLTIDKEGIQHLVIVDPESNAEWDEKYGEEGTLEFGASLEQGPRDTMEDFITIVPRARCGFLFTAVFDGHGGHCAAEYLSNNLYSVFSEEIDLNAYGDEQPVDGQNGGLFCPTHFSPVLEDAFRDADSTLLKWLEKNASGDELLSGSTATVALIRRDKIVVANVGDSRAVLCRNGGAVDLSTEHRVYGKGPTVESETERVESVGGWVGDGRVCDVLAVSRAFGDREFKGSGLKTMLEKGVESDYWDQEFADSVNFIGDPVVANPDVLETAVQPDDEFLILATDGLWDVVTSRDAVSTARNALKKGESPQKVAEKLTQMAVNRKTVDNVGVVVVTLGQGPLQSHTQSSKKNGWKLF